MEASRLAKAPILIVALLVLSLSVCVAFSGCGNSNSKFVGTWQMRDSSSNLFYNTDYVFTLKSDDTWIASTDTNGKVTGTTTGSSTMKGTYTVKGDTVTLKRTDVADATFVFKISEDGSTLKSMAEGDTVVLKKVKS